MANRLKAAMIQALVTLWRQGWSQRQIAKRLGVDRETVGRYVRRLEALANPANVHTGSVATGSTKTGPPPEPRPPNPANVITGSGELRPANPANVITGSGAAAGPVEAVPGELAAPNPAILITGYEDRLAANPAILITGSEHDRRAAHFDIETLAQLLASGDMPVQRGATPTPIPRPCACAPYREIIQAKFDQGLSALIAQVARDPSNVLSLGHPAVQRLPERRYIMDNLDSLPFFSRR